eukprot:RCo012382
MEQDDAPHDQPGTPAEELNSIPLTEGDGHVSAELMLPTEGPGQSPGLPQEDEPDDPQPPAGNVNPIPAPEGTGMTSEQSEEAPAESTPELQPPLTDPPQAPAAEDAGESPGPVKNTPASRPSHERPALFPPSVITVTSSSSPGGPAGPPSPPSHPSARGSGGAFISPVTKKATLFARPRLSASGMSSELPPSARRK